MIRHAWIGAHADVTEKRQCVLAGVSRTTVCVKRKPVVFVESDEVLSRLTHHHKTTNTAGYLWDNIFGCPGDRCNT